MRYSLVLIVPWMLLCRATCLVLVEPFHFVLFSDSPKHWAASKVRMAICICIYAHAKKLNFHFGMCHEGFSSDLLDVFWLICTSVWEADLEMLMLMRLLKKLHSCNRLPIFLESSPTVETFRRANHLSMNGKWSLHMRLKQLDLHQNFHLCPSYACSRRRRCSSWNQKQFEVKDHKGSRLSRLAGQRCQRERRWHFFQSSWSSWSSICRTCSIWGCDMARLEVQQDGVCRGFWSWSHGWKFQEWLIMLLIQPLKAGFIKRSKLCYLPFAWFTVVIFHVWFWYIIAINPYKKMGLVWTRRKAWAWMLGSQ